MTTAQFTHSHTPSCHFQRESLGKL